MTDTTTPDPIDPDLQDEMIEDIELETEENGAADEALHLVEDPDGEIADDEIADDGDDA